MKMITIDVIYNLKEIGINNKFDAGL